MLCHTRCQGSNTSSASCCASNINYQHGAALTWGWIFFLARRPRVWRAGGMEGSVIVMCHNFLRGASCSGYGWGQRCYRGSVSLVKPSGVICTELFAGWWEQLGRTGNLIRFQSKHSSAGSRGLSRNVAANCICLRFPQTHRATPMKARSRWNRNHNSWPQRAPQALLQF